VVVEELKRARAVTTSALLAEAQPLRCEGDTLVIGFRYSVLRDKWERGENRQRLTAALQSVLGQPMVVRSEALAEEPAADRLPGGERPAGGARGPRSRSTGAETASGVEQVAAADPFSAEPTLPVARSGNGAGVLEGEALLHEVIATFDGQIVEDSRE
jgi:hypothetical protein